MKHLLSFLRMALMVLLALPVVLIASPVHTYTNRAAFLADVSTALMAQDFEGVDAGTTLGNGTLFEGVTLTHSASGYEMLITGDFKQTTPSGGHSLGLDTRDKSFLSGDVLEFDFHRPMQAFGLNVICSPDDIESGDLILSAGEITVSVGSLPDAVLEDGGEVYFLGIYVENPEVDSVFFVVALSSLEPDTASPGAYVFNLDDLSYAGAVYNDISPMHYVAPKGGALWPYTNWTTAARTIQPAVDAAASGDSVLVAGGVYYPSVEISVPRIMTIEGVDGRDFTVIDGQNLHRCFNLSFCDSFITGFTVCNGLATNDSGGGIYCGSAASEINDCILLDNESTGYGGGIYGGILNRCLLNGNRAQFGGGSFYSTLNNCILTGNSAYEGGGSYGASLRNCTVTDNSADAWGGGSSGDALENCIVWNNSAVAGKNWYNSFFSCSCTTPLPSGIGNINSDPLFVSLSDFHLQPSSPCIDLGDNLGGIALDFDWLPRPLDGDADSIAIHDMGAYEFYNPAGDSDGDGLTDGFENDVFGTSMLNVNTDGDCFSDYEEYVAETDGANSNDFFRVLGCSGRTVWFQSSSNRIYTLLWSLDLESGLWWPTRTQIRIPGSGGIDYMTDPFDDPACFYKVQVELP